MLHWDKFLSTLLSSSLPTEHNGGLCSRFDTEGSGERHKADYWNTKERIVDKLQFYLLMFAVCGHIKVDRMTVASAFESFCIVNKTQSEVGIAICVRPRFCRGSFSAHST